MLYQSSFLLLFCFRNFPLYYFTVFPLPMFVKRQFATSQQQEKRVSLCTEQHNAFYTNLSLCRLVPEGIAGQDCGTGQCSGSSVCTSCSSQPDWCHWAGEVVLTHQPHVKLCWLLPARNSAPNLSLQSPSEQLTLICQLHLCNCLTMASCLSSCGSSGPQCAGKYRQLIFKALSSCQTASHNSIVILIQEDTLSNTSLS